jgi:hypothetical protein
MVSTFSPNKTLELPGFNDYVNSWNTPLNSDMTIIDAALGGSTLLNATSPTGTVTLTFAQYRPLSLIVSGAMTADVFYTIPAGVGGQWTVTNGTTGAFSVYMVSAAGGASVRIPQGYSTIVSCDGGATGMRLSTNTLPIAAGSNTQVQYNSGGLFAGSNNLTFNGTTLAASALSLGSALSVANGGTGITTTPANGQIPIGNGSGYTAATLTAGPNIVVTNSAGAITITAVGGGTGSVTSVDVSGGTTGLTTSGGPVTTNGTITLAGTLGVANGGTGITTVPSNGRIPIGNGTGYTASTITAGSNITVTNSAGGITIAAAGGGSGSVTSVNVSGGTTGLTTSGGPVTTSGTITLAGTLGVANGGTGSTTLTANNVLLGNGTSAVQAVAPGTTGNVLTSNGTTWTSASAAPTNGYRRNRIINGAMQINQRYVAASHTIPIAGEYTTDRWFAYTIGANATGQVVAGPTGYQFTYQMTGAAGITNLAFVQKIESFNVADLVNQNATISAVISNTLLTSVDWAVYSANSSDNFGAVTLVASGSWTVSPTATLYTATFNAGANAANGLQLGFIVGAQTSGTFKVTGVQLEPGSLATPFERQLISDTLAQCQRYYWTLGRTVSQSGATATGFGFTMTSSIQFPVTMRTAPTLTAASSSSVNMTIVGAIGAGQSGFDFYGTTNGATSPNYAAMTFTSATASAEL